MNTKDRLNKIIEFLNQKKYSYIKVLDISKVSTICDYFVIVSFNNIRTTEVIENEIEDYIAKYNMDIRSTEGKGTNWILIDLQDIIIHIFNESERTFYNLEKLWADADVVEV